jgi:hypothetical protein
MQRRRSRAYSRRRNLHTNGPQQLCPGHKSFEFGETRAADGKIAQRVHILDIDGVPWEALYTLELPKKIEYSLHSRLSCATIQKGGAVKRGGAPD